MSEAREAVIASQMEPLDYAVLGVLWSAKWETGGNGARRLWRIALRLDAADEKVADSLRKMIRLGMVEQQPEVLGMIHYQALTPDADNNYSVKLKGR
jgi:hypothetical protein